MLEYDRIDISEGISSIKWTVLGHFLTPNFTPKTLTHDNKIFVLFFYFFKFFFYTYA